MRLDDLNENLLMEYIVSYANFIYQSA